MPPIWSRSVKPAFRDISPEGRRVPISFGSQTLMLKEGANLAAELLAAGIATLRRTPVSGAPRGPFCMMGACYECLVQINGETRQACMTEVAEGMVLAPATGGGEHD